MFFFFFTSVVYFQCLYDALRRNKRILIFVDKLTHCTLPHTRRQITHDALWEAGGPASLWVVPGGSAVCVSWWSYDFPKDHLASFSTYGVSFVVCLFLIPHSVCIFLSITSFLFLLLLPNFLVVFLKLSLAVCLYPFLQFLSGFKNFNEPGFLCTFCSGELSPKMLHLGFDVTVTLIIDWLMNGTASQPLFSSLWEPS